MRDTSKDLVQLVQEARGWWSLRVKGVHIWSFRDGDPGQFSGEDMKDTLERAQRPSETQDVYSLLLERDGTHVTTGFSGTLEECAGYVDGLQHQFDSWENRGFPEHDRRKKGNVYTRLEGTTPTAYPVDGGEIMLLFDAWTKDGGEGITKDMGQKMAKLNKFPGQNITEKL